MTIARHYILHAAAGQESGLESTLKKLADIVSGMPGSHGVELMRDGENAARFILIEKWASLDAHKSAVAAFPKDISGAMKAALDRPLEGAYFHYLR